MLFKSFKELCESPLALRDDASVEQILLELDLKCGGRKLSVEEICRILDLIHGAYHTLNDRFEAIVTIQAASSPQQNWTKHIMSIWRNIQPSLIPTPSVSVSPIQIVDDLPSFTYPSDVILKNIFTIMFTTDEWNEVVLDKNFKLHVEELQKTAKSSTFRQEYDKIESWKRSYDHRAGELLEIWSELLERISKKEKARELK